MSSDTPTAVDGWSLLRVGQHVASGLEIPTVPAGVTTPSGPVRFALGQKGEPRLLLPVSSQERIRGLDTAPSLQIGEATYSSGGSQTRFLDLMCCVADLEGVFAEVTEEILARISSGQGCVAAAQSTIEDFRALLLRPPSRDVPITSVSGLIGELLVLNRFLDRSPRAWRAWLGPTGDRHDFRAGRHSLEVKSSTTLSRDTVVISSIDQLEAPAGGELHLLYFTLEKVPGGLLSVSALGRAAIEKSDEPDRVRNLLAAVGCTDVDATEWNVAKFRLEREQSFRVCDRFPRLVKSMLSAGALPKGIVSLTYEVDLGSAVRFRCEPDELSVIEKEMVECLSPE